MGENGWWQEISLGEEQQENQNEGNQCLVLTDVYWANKYKESEDLGHRMKIQVYLEE